MDLDHICQFSGLVMIIGSLFLIFKEKVYLDAVTKEVMFVELPKLGKLRTNAPILAVIALGLVAVIYPVYLDRTTYITVRGKVESNIHPVSVYAVASQATSGNNEDLIIAIPQLPSKDYQPHIVFRVGSAFDDETVDLRKVKNGVIELDTVRLIDVNTAAVLQGVDATKPAGFK
jgi:hypothetical protein